MKIAFHRLLDCLRVFNRFESFQKIVNSKDEKNLLNARVKLFAEPLCVEVPEDDPAKDGVDGGVGE